MKIEEVLEKEGFTKYIPAENMDKIKEIIQRTYFVNGRLKVEFYVRKGD